MYEDLPQINIYLAYVNLFNPKYTFVFLIASGFRPLAE